MTRRVAIVAVVIVLLIAAAVAAGFASCATTTYDWIGGLPEAEVRLRVLGPDGQPLKGATLYIYDGRTGQAAWTDVVLNFGPGLVSDEEGRITLVTNPSRYGGRGWYLFWFIPMGDRGPDYQCEIRADGFESLRFDVWRLFDAPYTSYDDIPKTTRRLYGREIELPLYEHTFTLTPSEDREPSSAGPGAKADREGSCE
ncbi:MAG: hypothetical protein ACOC8E_00450 [Planctomycetota bacterium]